jgi:hypothetical protein
LTSDTVPGPRFWSALNDGRLGTGAGAENSRLARFECIWWNERQMNGMDPNNPPPKQTRIVLKRWEYSDPIGVPHPDSVDVAIDAKNGTGAALDGAVVEVEAQWLEGPQRRKAASMWSALSPVGKPLYVSLAPDGQQSLTVPIDLAAKMKALEPSRRWPWALRAFITVKRGGAVIGWTQLELPIAPGD